MAAHIAGNGLYLTFARPVWNVLQIVPGNKQAKER